MSEQIQFEIGDRVWSFSRQERGEVREIGQQGMVMVVFGPHNFGWFDPSTLFFEEIVIPPSARTRPKHAFKPGDPVCVRRSSKNALWLLRAFVEERNGEFVCVSGRGWQDGWPECVPYDPTLLGFDAVEEKNNERNSI